MAQRGPALFVVAAVEEARRDPEGQAVRVLAERGTSQNTDAVAVIGRQVLSSVKTPTTQDVTSGIVHALKLLLDGGELSPGDVAAVMIGTTHFTNAVVQRRDLLPVAAVRIGLQEGAFVVKAWAPAYYRNLTRGQAGPNDTVDVHVVLETRPPDLVTMTTEWAEGYCSLGVATPWGRECQSQASVEAPLPAELRNLTVRLEWNANDLGGEIAFEIGFQSLTHFNRVFRKIVGMSPTEYRGQLPSGACRAA